jgi:hypothetical protein
VLKKLIIKTIVNNQMETETIIIEVRIHSTEADNLTKEAAVQQQDNLHPTEDPSNKPTLRICNHSLPLPNQRREFNIYLIKMLKLLYKENFQVKELREHQLTKHLSASTNLKNGEKSFGKQGHLGKNIFGIVFDHHAKRLMKLLKR